MKKYWFSTILVPILFSGCASTSRPTSAVGIVNRQYALQTTMPNNNKGKKVRITYGQSYHCVYTHKGVDMASFDLKASSTEKSFLAYNKKVKGKKVKGNSGRYVYDPKYGHVGTEKKDGVLVLLSDNSGRIAVYNTKKAFLAKRGLIVECTQTTNNSYTHTRYLTNHEISAYQHNQQIAVQQKAINDANYNASMSRMQAQNAQANYNLQQSMNRSNTYNVKVY